MKIIKEKTVDLRPLTEDEWKKARKKAGVYNLKETEHANSHIKPLTSNVLKELAKEEFHKHESPKPKT
jgi:hypothetical protein